MRSFRLFMLVLNLTAFACKQAEKDEIYYYPTGEVKEEYEIEEGKRHGAVRGYYQNGKFRLIGFYKKGIPDSIFVHYYQNGNKDFEGTYDEKGIRTGEMRFYFETGELKQIQYLNDKGKVFDYVTFNKDGTKNQEFERKLIIFESLSDSIQLGDYYEANVRLANRKYSYTDVILGDPKEKHIFDKERLPKKDSVTSLLQFKPDKLGKLFIEGIILDVDFKINGEDTTIFDYQVIDFRKPIWVLPPKGSKSI